jgi:RNA recognition motif-containing protein
LYVGLLQELFGRYGTIIDLRIHSKQNNKGAPGSRVPNYGFITFENPDIVQKVLSMRVSDCSKLYYIGSQVEPLYTNDLK